MAYSLGAKSLAKLDGVHPDLVRVVKRAIALTSQDFMVLCGVRTLAEQKALYAQGRTKPGPIVTWTLKSRHLPTKDPKTGEVFGRAVDLVPFPVDWNTLSKFDAVAKAVFAASKELGIPIRWGANWDGDGKPRERGESDSPHFELE